MPRDDEIIELLSAYGVLERGQSPWPTHTGVEGERRQVDWHTLFPRLRELRRQQQESRWDVPEDTWKPEWDAEFLDALEVDLKREEPPDEELREIGKTLLWDVCAWYQPIHFFAEYWGIYIREDCLVRQARLISRFIPSEIRQSGSLRGLAKCLIRASAYAFFLHEHYHHKIESLGIRLLVVDRRSCYLPYQTNVYNPTKGTDSQLEEALANADIYHRFDTDPYRSWITFEVVDATRRYLARRFPYDLPGYRMAINYLSQSAFENGENMLHSQVHEASLTPLQPPHEWNVATRLTQSLFKVTDNIWVIVKPGGRTILPTRGHI